VDDVIPIRRDPTACWFHSICLRAGQFRGGYQFLVFVRLFDVVKMHNTTENLKGLNMYRASRSLAQECHRLEPGISPFSMPGNMREPVGTLYTITKQEVTGCLSLIAKPLRAYKRRQPR
jgi:hypothetical protein